jgi:leucyl-tRNA synthetase
MVSNIPLGIVTSGINRDLHRKCHQTIKKVTQNIESNFHFNTAISAIMELFNAVSAAMTEHPKENISPSIVRKIIETMLILLSPMVPHFASEMWTALGNSTSIENLTWPEFDEEIAKEEMLTIVLQVNGKVRSRILVEADIDDATLKAIALEDESVKRFIGTHPVKKTIVVKKKLVNIVI